MTMLTKLRAIALTVIALGTMQLGTARAATPAAKDTCDDQAYDLLGYGCDVVTGGDWDIGIMWYTCDENGNFDQGYFECYSY